MLSIPKRFAKLLSGDRTLNGAVQTTFGRFEPWFADNKTVFFPGFTDHGTTHIEAVLRGAEQLIRKESWRALTPQDAAVGLLAILLHDAAMHLSEDGFITLVSAKEPCQVRSDFATSTDWRQLWEAFLVEASRFDERKLIDMFDSPEPIGRPPEDSLKWTARHRLLIGEFVRRHHAALAHEFALAGVPGPGNSKLVLAEMQDWQRDIAGFIARSHGLNLRACVDRLPTNSKRDWRGVHAPFLMALLRIADYLEIQAPRAPGEILQVRSLRSPFSRQEWRNHQDVKYIQPHENDPECLWVDAKPRDVKTYLALRRLLEGIQGELDATWTVLGEVYGRDPALRDLGIRIRRIRSTIDNPDEFGKSVKYIPVRARFTTSDAEVLKRLVAPLYGNEPSYGIRELVQNAVDACRERDDHLAHAGNAAADLAPLPADVVVTLEEEEDGRGWLIVEDRGIGMTPDVVLRYFLTAGASFRSSDQWHEQHVDPVDGTPRVLRSGRFGVGILAAFLLGSELEVSTRFIQEPRSKGVKFSCRLEDSEIELRWFERPVGTTIRVRTDEYVIGRLTDYDEGATDTWDWYTAASPSVRRQVKLQRPRSSPKARTFTLGHMEEISQNHHLPAACDVLPPEWRRLVHPDFEDVQWTWGSPCLVCNGFRVEETRGGGSLSDCWSAHENEYSAGVALRSPSFNVFDRRGSLPLNLVRTALASEGVEAFGPDLLDAVCRDILAFLLVRNAGSVERCLVYLLHSLGGIVTPQFLRGEEGLLHPAISLDFMNKYHWLSWNRSGLVLSEPEIFRMAGSPAVWFFPDCYPVRPFPPPAILETMAPDHLGLLTGTDDYSRDESEDWSSGESSRWLDAVLYGPPPRKDRESFSSEDIGLRHFGPWLHFDVTGRAALVTNRFIEKRPGSFPDVNRLDVGKDWTLLSRGEDPRDWLDLERLKTWAPAEARDSVGFWKLGAPLGAQLPISPLGTAWKRIFGQGVLPFDLEERRAQLAHAYRELAEPVSRWEQGAGTYWSARRTREG